MNRLSSYKRSYETGYGAGYVIDKPHAGFFTGYQCLICGDLMYELTHAHAERHGLTKTELQKHAKPLGYKRRKGNTVYANGGGTL